MKRPLPRYLCLSCHWVWSMTKPTMMVCPQCDALYIKWVNYKEFTR